MSALTSQSMTLSSSAPVWTAFEALTVEVVSAVTCLTVVGSSMEAIG